MISWVLKQHWRGTSSEGLGTVLAEPKTAEQIDEMIAKERDRIADDALDSIAKRAMEGDVAAVEWLESRGLINMPGKYEHSESDS